MIKIIHQITIVFIIFIITSCVQTNNKYQEMKLPTERSYHRGFSLVPPNEPGWFILSKNRNELALTKEVGQKLNESYVIATFVTRLPQITSQNAFNDAVEKLDTNFSSRFTLLKYHIDPYHGKGEYCARSYMVANDNAAAQYSGEVKSMIMENIGFGCQHPSDKRIVIYLTFSYRHFPGNDDPALMDKAEKLFQSVEFNDL